MHRSVWLAVVVVAGTAGAVRAEPVGIAVSSPFSWVTGHAFGASGYAAVTPHQVLRVNFARYDYTAQAVGTLLAAALGEDGDEASYSGGFTDVGVAWQYYPRHALDGFSVELGVLRRATDIAISDDSAGSGERVATTTTTFAGRALLGWTWLVKDHFFVGVAAGASMGHERGTERLSNLDEDEMTTPVSRGTFASEGLLRIGGAFDL